MRSQSAISAKTPCSLSLNLSNNNNNKDHIRSTTPSATSKHQKTFNNKLFQMTTGNGISTKSNNNSPPETTISSTPTLASLNNNNNSIPIGKSSSSSSSTTTTTRNLSTNNNLTTAINNNNNKKSSTNDNSHPNATKLKNLELRKQELEKLLSEKNLLLQQIQKKEAQILNGNVENFSLYEFGKANGSGNTPTSSTGSMLRRRASSSLKLPKGTNIHSNGKSNRFTLSKSEYDLAVAQDSKQAITNVIGMKKRQGPPQKTNSFHDTTSMGLSVVKSPSASFEYNNDGGGEGSASGPGIIYSILRPPYHQNSGSNENLAKNLGITQCDKYYLSPTSQMYTDGNGFIKASQNIKQCLSSSPSPMHKIMSNLSDPNTNTNGHHSSMMLKNGGYPAPIDNIDAMSLTPLSSNIHLSEQQNFWVAIPNSDRCSAAAYSDNNYIEMDNESMNPYHSLKPLSKKIVPSGSSLSQQHSPEYAAIGNFYHVGAGSGSIGGGSGGSGLILGTSYPPNTLEKALDELSISSVNSETNKKPKNKQWLESSLDGPIIRPNALQTPTLLTDGLNLYQTMSPMLSPLSPLSPHNQSPLRYAYYNVGRQSAASTVTAATIPSGKLTSSPSSVSSGGGVGLVGAGGLLLSQSRPPTRTLTHQSHPQHYQPTANFHRERNKLSSQSMSSGSYRAPKAKLDDDNSHLSHSTSYLNYDPFHHHHFQQKQQQQPDPSQLYHHNHYHMEVPPSGSFHHQQQQKPKPLKSQPPPSILQAKLGSNVHRLSPSMESTSSAAAMASLGLNDDYGTILYVPSPPSRLSNNSNSSNSGNNIPNQAAAATNKKLNPPNTLPLPSQISPGSGRAAGATTSTTAVSPDIRIESPKNMTIVQQATFLPYKEVTKPFEMSDFYKYSTKFRQKEANTATISSKTST